MVCYQCASVERARPRLQVVMNYAGLNGCSSNSVSRQSSSSPLASLRRSPGVSSACQRTAAPWQGQQGHCCGRSEPDKTKPLHKDRFGSVQATILNHGKDDVATQKVVSTGGTDVSERAQTHSRNSSLLWRRYPLAAVSMCASDAPGTKPEVSDKSLTTTQSTTGSE